VNQDWAHRIVDETNLFIDARPACHAKLQQQGSTGVSPVSVGKLQHGRDAVLHKWTPIASPCTFCAPKTPASIDRQRLVPMFHLWIRDQGLTGRPSPGSTVARLSARKNGPGVVAGWAGTQAIISMDDESDGRLGLLYQRKRPFGNSFSDRLKTTASSRPWKPA